MQFRKYMHIEKFGTDEVHGIELGGCYVFPKLDGTNGSIWNDGGALQAGSRNRQLSLDADNAGFLKACLENENLVRLIEECPGYYFYGEWLVPHSLKTYRQDAWRQFYIFDIFSDESDCYLNYESIAEVCSAAHVNYVVPLCEIHNATYDNLLIELKNNTFLIEDGQGAGEGIVIKNYDFQNRFGRTTWAKITTSEFKEKHAREMGAPSKVMKAMTEQAICDEYLTAEMVDKVYANIVNECGGWNSKYIPRLLMTSFYDLVNEEMWAILKKFKNPTVNFKTLYSLVILKIKNQLRPELF